MRYTDQPAAAVLLFSWAGWLADDAGVMHHLVQWLDLLPDCLLGMVEVDPRLRQLQLLH